MIAIAAALTSSIAWGLADYLGGVAARRTATITVLAISQAIGLALVASVVAVRGAAAPPTADLIYAAGAGTAGVIGLGMFYRALAVGTMSIVAPLAATGTIIPVVVGIATGDTLKPLLLLGIVVALAGVMMAAREHDDDTARGPDAAGDGAHRRAVVMALMAALGFGLFLVLLDRGSENDVFWAVLAQRCASVTLSVAAFAVIAGARSSVDWRAHLPLIATIGLFDAMANVLYAFASTRGALSVIALLSSLYPVVTVLLAHRLLRERLSPVQRTGIVLTMAGVAVVAALGA